MHPSPVSLLLATLAAAGVAGVFYSFYRRKSNSTNRFHLSTRRIIVVDGDDDHSRLAKLKKHCEHPKFTELCSRVSVEEVFVYSIPKLQDVFDTQQFENCVISDESKAEYMNIIHDNDVILADIVRKENQPSVSRAYVRAGPRQLSHFYPPNVRAAIVTCGGLCPGLNTVIREITNSLHFLYNTQPGAVLGVKGGYAGFGNEPIVLTPESVANIHHLGGSILGSTRGGFNIEVILDFLRKWKINQVYVIGGDGTHRGALALGAECERQNMNISVVGIPKTIDNDLDLIDRSFGFETAVEAAQAAIGAAKTEATCNLPNGIGIVKLMGRSTGFIAAFATMASGDVDLCLVPEVPIVLEGEDGCLPHLQKRIAKQGHAVVVVAEGAGEELLGKSAEKDASGNRKLPPIGVFLQQKINDFFSNQGVPVTVKYIDPSYMIRSVPPNSADSRYCIQLGQAAVHGAMAGFTRFTVGLCNNRLVYLPITALVDGSPRGMRMKGRTWERVLSITRQPNPKSDGTKKLTSGSE